MPSAHRSSDHLPAITPPGEARPVLDTVDLSESIFAPSTIATPFDDGPPSEPGVIDRGSIFDAIRPNPTPLNEDSARRLALPLLDTPDEVSDTEPPPPLALLPPLGLGAPAPAASVASPHAPPAESATWWSSRSSGVRPIRRDVAHEGPRIVANEHDLSPTELARAQPMIVGTIAIGFAGALLLQVVTPTFDLFHVLATAAVVGALGLALGLKVLVHFYGALSRRQHLALGIVAIGALLAVLAHGGPASPVALIGALIAYHYAGGDRPSEAVGITLASAIGILLVGGLTAAGVFVPSGPFAVSPVLTLSWTACLSGFVAICAGVSRLQLGRVQSLVRRGRLKVSRREALLDEAYSTIGTLRCRPLGHRSGGWLGRYHVSGLLGRSHRAEIYDGRTHGGERAAIKLFEPTFDRFHAMQMFNQATSASAVSPAFVRVYDFGALPGGSFFIATERLRGPDLATQLREPWAMNVTESVILLTEVAEGLERAHESRLCHGNLKPENIVRDADDRWRITDFATTPAVLHQSVPTPRYGAPELVRSRPTPQSDVFALAAIAYRLIVRCPPLSDSDPFETGAAPRPVRPSILAALPPDVDAIFALGMAADPALRMSSPVEFVAALKLALNSELQDAYRRRAVPLLANGCFAEPSLVE